MVQTKKSSKKFKIDWEKEILWLSVSLIISFIAAIILYANKELKSITDVFTVGISISLILWIFTSIYRYPGLRIIVLLVGFIGGLLALLYMALTF